MINWLARTIGDGLNIVVVFGLLSLPACSSLPEIKAPALFSGLVSNSSTEGRGCSNSDKTWKETLVCAQNNIDQFCREYRSAGVNERRTMDRWLVRVEGVTC